jgi:(2R)-3-sulfolactate dehydrogenase (NADP+)
MTQGTVDADTRCTLSQIEDLAHAALSAHRTNEANARSMARSIAAAEADGIRSHGLLRLPTYCAQAACGKVDGHATPSATRTAPGAWQVDACDGFAHPAIELGLAEVVPTAMQQGIAALSIVRSYNCGVVGHHVERLAEQGLLALALANTPAAIAPWGGNQALFGTNPIALAAPRSEGPPLVVDQSASVVARGEVLRRARQGEPIPLGWALDEAGLPTADPQAALRGSMLPAGGHKGAGLALLVELLAAALTGASFSFAASSFLDTEGGPPRTGQLFIAIDPRGFVGELFAARVELLLGTMCAQPGVRLPGARRYVARAAAQRDGVLVNRALHQSVVQLAHGPHGAA